MHKTTKIVINGEVLFPIRYVAEQYDWNERSLRTLIRNAEKQGKPMGTKIGKAHLLRQDDIDYLLSRRGMKGQYVSERPKKQEKEKRPRGRPRKTPVIKLPAKLGRPRKNTAEQQMPSQTKID